jgi:hypothetical protein
VLALQGQLYVVGLVDECWRHCFFDRMRRIRAGVGIASSTTGSVAIGDELPGVGCCCRSFCGGGGGVCRRFSKRGGQGGLARGKRKQEMGSIYEFMVFSFAASSKKNSVLRS